jgi:hypothetical protein
VCVTRIESWQESETVLTYSTVLLPRGLDLVVFISDLLQESECRPTVLLPRGLDLVVFISDLLQESECRPTVLLPGLDLVVCISALLP